MVRVGRRRSFQSLWLDSLLGNDGGGLYEEGFAAVGGESVLDEVEETGVCQHSTAESVSKMAGLLSAEFLEQALELFWRGEENQALEQAGGLAVCNLQFLAVGLFPHAGQEDVAVVGALELVELEHFVCLAEVLELLLVEHSIEGCVIRAAGLAVGKLLDSVVGSGERAGVVVLMALGTGVVVEVPLALLVLVAAAALLVFLGHGGR